VEGVELMCFGGSDRRLFIKKEEVSEVWGVTWGRRVSHVKKGGERCLFLIFYSFKKYFTHNNLYQLSNKKNINIQRIRDKRAVEMNVLPFCCC